MDKLARIIITPGLYDLWQGHEVETYDPETSPAGKGAFVAALEAATPYGKSHAALLNARAYEYFRSRTGPVVNSYDIVANGGGYDDPSGRMLARSLTKVAVRYSINLR